ncbi:MAG: hypothetical protein DRJ47_03560 [Thermoprotei archaeon]|nr:MAG: hypothetical protein DRJ47_03560 [Thermoprotei archaeon]
MEIRSYNRAFFSVLKSKFPKNLGSQGTQLTGKWDNILFSPLGVCVSKETDKHRLVDGIIFLGFKMVGFLSFSRNLMCVA